MLYRGEFELYGLSDVKVLKNGIETSQTLYEVMRPGSEQAVLLAYVDTLKKHCIEYLNRYGQESWEVIQIERQVKDESRTGFADSLSALGMESSRSNVR